MRRTSTSKVRCTVTKNEKFRCRLANSSSSTPESKLPTPESKLGMASSTSTLLVDPEGKLRIVSTATAGKELKQRFGLRPAYVIKLLMPLHKRKTVNE